MWFDQDELRKAKDATETDLRWMDFDIWKDRELFHVEVDALKCPRCNVQLAAIQYGPTRVTVDTCVKCHGVWLDHGEFEQIIAALEEQAASMTVDDYRKAALQEAKELVKGKEGFVSEWRDLGTVLRFMQYRIMVENPKVQEAIIALDVSSPFQ
jgi:Zn-finger nucleic acid-binding protein